MADQLVIPGQVCFPQGQPHSWHYQPGRAAFHAVPFAILIAAGIHVGLLFLNGRTPDPLTGPIEKSAPIGVVVIQKTAPLEEPEVVQADAPRKKPEAGAYVPTLPDAPSPAIDKGFVQPMAYSTLTPTSEAVTVTTIPVGSHAAGVDAESISGIFDPTHLDRAPEAVFQPPPAFPPHLKREGTATVAVEFVVDAEGKVASAKVLESSHPGFEKPAILGVMRWQFRPGMKHGRAVATRMVVPLIFRVEE